MVKTATGQSGQTDHNGKHGQNRRKIQKNQNGRIKQNRQKV